MLMKVFRKTLLAIMLVSIQIQQEARAYFLSTGILPVFFLVQILIFLFMGFKQKTYFILALGGINGHQVFELNNAVSVYMFDYQTYTGNSKLGLQIFNENKDEIFNSNLKYLRVLDVIYYPPGLPTTSLIKTYNHKIGILIGAFKIGATDSGDPLFQCVSFPSENSIKIDASTGDSLEGTTNMLVINLDGVD